MNALSQVRLLLLKDMRRLRWLLAAYVVLIVTASLGALELASNSMLWMRYAPMLVLVTGCAVVALAVQADSPSRADAFWMSRPLSRGAVLGAKFALAGLVITLALTGIGLTLLWLGFAGNELLRPMAQGSLVFGAWMLPAMAVAALSRDLRGFLGTCIVLGSLFIASAASRVNFGWAFHSGTANAAVVSIALLHVAPAAVLVLVYLRRDSLQVGRTVGILAFALIAIVKPYVQVFATPKPSEPVWLAANEAPRVSVTVDELGKNRPELVRLRVRVTPWRNADYVAVAVTGLVVYARDGASVQLKDKLDGFAVPVHDSSPSGSPWHGPDLKREIDIELTARERSALASGIERVAVTGFVYPYAAVVRGDLPFATGGRTRDAVPVIMIDSVRRVGERTSAKVSLLRTRIGTEEMPYGPRGGGGLYLPRYVLLDDSTHTVSPMGLRSQGTAGRWVIVPGAILWLNWAHVDVADHSPAAGYPQRQRSARLRYVDWHSLGWGVLHVSSTIE